MEHQIGELLDYIIENVKPPDSADFNNEIETYTSYIYEFYKNKLPNERHKYSDISHYMYELSPDTVDVLIEKIEAIRSKLSSGDELVDEKLNKLDDHIKLERDRTILLHHLIEKNGEEIVNLVQNIYSEVLSSTSEQIKTATESSKQLINETEEKMSKTQKRIDDITSQINTQIVTVLGIFAAIVVVFFGGTSAYKSVFETLEITNLVEIIFIISAIGFILFNIIFMLLYTISKIIDKPISSKNSVIEHNFFERAKEKYPFIYYFDIALSTIIVLSFIISLVLFQ